ncbi:hypothetical protein ASU31_01665 [Pedobacter ginsenosidimutans]|uniref:Uncharacterized protein n=1 Tax=Pedobacter ginsenosidimutans TaxID=687842 RepID=A0A0T5VW37_9SPHI|nr:hypothetical protein ASU31_01665 [Pedobacter ginsenosidimutans]
MVKDVLFDQRGYPKGLQRTAGRNPAYMLLLLRSKTSKYLIFWIRFNDSYSKDDYFTHVKKCKIFQPQGNKTVLL